MIAAAASARRKWPHPALEFAQTFRVVRKLPVDAIGKSWRSCDRDAQPALAGQVAKVWTAARGQLDPSRMQLPPRDVVQENRRATVVKAPAVIITRA